MGVDPATIAAALAASVVILVVKYLLAMRDAGYRHTRPRRASPSIVRWCYGDQLGACLRCLMGAAVRTLRCDAVLPNALACMHQAVLFK
ncbi:MAG: hypothetical protein J3K34DRAFT_435332 [Monoraphidium minutum]|nr:MAG: hypothetical protein J3K34DRAFT_435332 [Monoraphidium minutum]